MGWLHARRRRLPVVLWALFLGLSAITLMVHAQEDGAR
jgi:hypothetical protein